MQKDSQLLAAQVREQLIRPGTWARCSRCPWCGEDRILGRPRDHPPAAGRVLPRRGGHAEHLRGPVGAGHPQRPGCSARSSARSSTRTSLVETSPVAIVTMNLDGRGGRMESGRGAALRLPRPPRPSAHHMEELIATPRPARGGGDQHSGHPSRASGSGPSADAPARTATIVDVEISSMPVLVDGAKVGMIGHLPRHHRAPCAPRQEAETANEAKSAFLATIEPRDPHSP